MVKEEQPSSNFTLPTSNFSFGVGIDGRVGEIANHHVFGEATSEFALTIFVGGHGVDS
jgi:hypothetical protein